VAFGSGGALLQRMDRDTQKCAFKCCEAVIDGVAVPVFKDPVTDPGKQSKKGQLRLVKDASTGAITTLTDGKGDDADDLLVEVYRNGAIVREWTWEQVVAHAQLGKTADKV
jgi:nicotinamide phosphoribosyltransferase